jgi:hypothetical protein
MSKLLNLQYNGTPIALALEKVDRAKLYGFTDIEVQDDEGRPCELATLNGDGHTLAGKGGAALAQLSSSGLWTDKSFAEAGQSQWRADHSGEVHL